MAKDYETDDGVRIAPLGAIRDFEVAEGYPDIRGWRVDSADGREVGKVHELLIDIDNMRTRYLDVRLTSDGLKVAGAPANATVHLTGVPVNGDGRGSVSSSTPAAL